MKLRQIIDETIGWYGAIALISAFALVSFELISPTSLIYQIINGTGALGIVYISFKKKTYQPGVLNIIWAIIAGIAIIRLIV
jgi:multidrug transporter EmrE-like cation transporter